MCSCHSIPECCVMFSGVKLSMGLFVLFNFDNLTSARITNLRGIINFYQQETIDSQLQLATLKYQNEKLSCENEKLKRVINIKDQLLNKYKVKLRGALCFNTKLRINILDAKKEVINKDHKFVLKNTFSARNSISRQLQVSPLDTSTRTTEFMAKVRFLQHTCLLSFQKASMAIDLCFNLFFSKLHPARFVPSPATLSSWNVILGEVDKINLRKKIVGSPYDFHIWADNSNKAGNDRHVCWHPHLEQ